jgi:hypothetical protein
MTLARNTYNYAINISCVFILLVYFAASFWLGAYWHVSKDMLMDKLINMNLVELGQVDTTRALI